MPKKAQRRFVGLDTEEVSLVDSPANEVEFLVTKNQTEDRDMGAHAEQQTNDDAVRVPLDVEGGEAVAKALEHVNGIVDKISNIVTKKAADEEPATGDVTDEADATETETEKGGGIKSILQAAGMKGKALEEAMAKLKKAGLDGIAPVEKNADDVDGDEEIVAEDDQPLTFATLQKAARFTPTRITQIQDAVETLKLVLEAIGQGQSPATKTPGVENHPNPNNSRRLAGAEKKPVMKSEEGDLASVLKALGGAVEKLDERLEAIEKARPASNSVEEDADITDTDTQPTQKSIWSGLL